MESGPDIPKTLGDLMGVAPAGFAIGLHIRFTAATFLFQTYPKAWVEEYSRDGLVVRDPAVVWGFANEGHITWAELAPQDEHNVFERAAAHGLRFGVAISLLRDGSRSLGWFARSDRDFTAEETAQLETGVAQLHDVTALVQSLPQDVRESLHRLSVAVTHP